MKKIVSALVVAFFLVAGISAQRATLQIQCNPSGAQVYIGGRLMGTAVPNLTLSLPPNSYPLKVTKTGYQPYETTVILPASGTVVRVNLLPVGATAAPPPVPTPAPQAKFALTVTSPAPNTMVFINGANQGMAPVTIQVIPGTYNISVRAPNSLEWTQQVQVVNAPVTVTPGMQPLSYSLQVTCPNAPGASILINGSQVGAGSYSGNLPGGTYTVVVRAPGYLDYNETFTLTGPKTINASLQAQNFMLQVGASNVSGAAILLNGNQVATGSFNGALPPGNYTIVIRAPGYNDYSETFTLAAPRSIAVALQPVLVSFTFSIPQNFYNPEVGSLAQGRQNDDRGNSGGKGNAYAYGQGRTIAIFELYVDGNLVAPSGDNVWNGAVTPGTHVFKILSGGLKIESSINLQPGRNWVLQPSLGIMAQ